MNGAMTLVESVESTDTRPTPSPLHSAARYPPVVTAIWFAVSTVLWWTLRLCSLPVPTVLFSATTLKDISATGIRLLSRSHPTSNLAQSSKSTSARNKPCSFPGRPAFSAAAPSRCRSTPLDTSSVCICLAESFTKLTRNSFYNTVWLILNDVIIGVAVGGFLQDNSEYLADLISKHAEVRPPGLIFSFD
jgi:hypothetical protein